AVRALVLVQAFLGQERFGGSRLVLVTSGAVGEGVADLGGAGVWGLVRSAQVEHPERLVLLDVDGDARSVGVVSAVVATGEPQLVVRAGVVLVPRLRRSVVQDALVVPDEQFWRLDTTAKGSLDALRLVPWPVAGQPLGPGQVRIAMRAGGLNFRDV